MQLRCRSRGALPGFAGNDFRCWALGCRDAVVLCSARRSSGIRSLDFAQDRGETRPCHYCRPDWGACYVRFSRIHPDRSGRI